MKLFKRVVFTVLLCSFFGQNLLAQITVKIKALPKDTPPDATFYIAGNFNNWDAGDTAYRMIKGSDGFFYHTFAKEQDSVVYKITRGSWDTVEGRSNGRARPNRSILNLSQKPMIVEIKIVSWEDLSGHKLSGYIVILALAAIQGFLLIFAINRLQNNNKKANTILSLQIALISFALLGRVLINFRDIFQAYPKIYLLPDIILFTFATLFYLYIRKLLTIQTEHNQKFLRHFIPFGIQIVWYISYFIIPNEEFKSAIVDNVFSKHFAIIGFIAFVYNTWYWYKSFEVIRVFKVNMEQTHSFIQNLNYFNTVITLDLLCITVWFVIFVVSILGLYFQFQYIPIIEYAADLIWILLSATTYALGYFAMYQPAIFKLSQTEGNFVTSVSEIPENKTKDVKQSVIIPQTISDIEPILITKPIEEVKEETPITKLEIIKNEAISENEPLTKQEEIQQQLLDEKEEELRIWKPRLEKMMENDKPYLNPQLTLPELSAMLQTTLHIVSRVINNGYNKNFFDFVNSYRIEEFKKLVLSDKYKNQTILAVAFDAGFNSKTAFNRAFKKQTGLTPREFLKQHNSLVLPEED